MNSSISASNRRQHLRAASSTGARRNLYVLGVSAVVTLFVYATMFVCHIGGGSAADWWLYDIMRLRDRFYREALTDFPAENTKVLVVGGSASLFGVNSAQIETAIGEPALNLGLHAGVDIDLLVAAASDYADTNDLVVVPLEFELYRREKPSDLSPRDFFAFFYRYADRLPRSAIWRFVKATNPITVVEATRKKLAATLFPKPRKDRLTDDALLAAWKAARAEPQPPDSSPYDYKSLTQHGDKDLARPTLRKDLARLSELNTPYAAEVSPFALEQLTRWRDEFASRGATFRLAWPVLLQDERGSLFTAAYWSKLIKLAREMDTHGLPIYCDPIGAIVPTQYRLDTVYHVNLKGAEIYSEGLAACLRDMTSDVFDYEAADPAELARRARERVESFRVPKAPFVFDFERNLSRLATLHDEIREAHSKEGVYPSALPDASNATGVWYRSDGHDFKLLIEDPKECYVAAFADPARIDPVRRRDGDCTAYGYWTQGAAGW